MSLPAFAARRRVSIGMLTVTLVLFGLIGLGGLPVNLLPDLSWPTLTVRTVQEGAAPLEVENLVTDPIEEALGVVKGVRRVRSVSRTGQSDVSLEFAWGTDMDMAGLEVRDKLDTLQLPLDTDKPLLLRFNPSADPIMRLALSVADESMADARRLKRLRRFADDELKKRIEPVSGVAAVKVGGGLEDQIDIVIDQQQLARLGMDMNQIISRLRAENINVSGGRIDEGDQRFLVRTVNQFADLDAMRDLLVVVDNGIPVHLRDIAVIEQGHKEREGVVRIGGREAIELAIYKEGDANTVDVARAVRAALARFDDALPEGAQLDTVEDQSRFIGQALAQVRGDAILGGLLAVLVIFFFLGHAWSTFIISLSLPVSLIATFFLMEQFNLSLNVMSLGGLALATGMVVDDSIVVLENIARLRDKGMSAIQAAIVGASEVSMAVTASTLTTVAVFVPLIFVHGIAGELFRDQALTITFAMLISLLVAMTLIPMMASLRHGATDAGGGDGDGSGEGTPPHGWLGVVPRALVWLVAASGRVVALTLGKPLHWLGQVLVRTPYEHMAASYHRMLPVFLVHPGKVVGCAAAAFVAAMALVPTLGMDLIPQLAQNRFEITATLPPGTPLAQTDALVREIAVAHAGDDAVVSIHGVAGSGTRLDANPTDAGENVARWTVALRGDVDSAGELQQMERMRQTLARRAGVDVTISRPQLFSFAAPLEIELRGHDLAALDRAANRLAHLLEDSPRFTDINSTVEPGHPEIAIRFDQQRAAAFGLVTRDIADQVMRKMRGEVATQYSHRDRKIDVLVRAAPGQRDSLEAIGELIVGHAAVDGGVGQPIRLAAVADIQRTQSPGQIHHSSQQRAAVVSTDIAYGDLGAALAEVRGLIADNPLAAGVRAHVGGQGEELGESSRSLLFALGLAIFLVYLVMASQFESLLHPFIIMFSIPLAAVGAVLALKLTGAPVSIVVFIGLILLVGIVVKNAIVLVDRINQLRIEGVAKRDAIAQAAESRLRPIVMTTLSTLIGFMPLALASGEGAEVRAPMAITVMGGLAVSTLLTLIVIPVLYDLFDRRGDAWYAARRGQERMAGSLVEAPA